MVLMELLPALFVVVVGFVSGVVSGMSGGGGAMIMIPTFIATGLPPQAAVATAKLSGLGGDFGGLAAFLKSGHIRKDITRVMIPVAVLVGLVTPLVFAAVSSREFQIALAVLMIALLPTLFIKKRLPKRRTRRHKVAGYSLYSVVLFLQGIFSGGVGSLAVYVLTLLFGTTKLETMATRRVIVAVLSPVTLVSLLIGGYVSVWLGLVGLAGAFAGTYVGSKIALRRGESFVTVVMALTIFASSVALLLTA